MFCQCSKDVYDENYRKVKRMIRVVELYKSNVFFKAVFDDTNTEKLRRAANLNMEVVKLDFDLKSIDWTDYLMNVHIPGLIKYAMK
ncbi:putative fatty acyl-CoA reductase 4, partial [Mucuna pruriens]